MEEEKLIRRKKKALYGSNRRALAEACNDLATFYYKHNRYQDALDEYKNEASICKELGLRMEWGTCNRMIGEMYMLQAEFENALKYEERHLAVAKELQNLVEEQRAMATLGRIYLLQGQSSADDAEAKTSLKAAEKAFMKSLVLCEKLNGKINKHELMDMRARLLLNIGVVLEHLGFLDKAVDCINKAITICSNQDLFEVLHNCYMTEALLLANRKKDYTKALSSLNKALEVARRLEDKILKMCETLSSKADILCKMSDYQSAKQVLLKAWKLKTPDEDERENIESNLRVVAAMCYTEELLVSTEPSDHGAFKRLFEQLGDGACRLRNYAHAAEHYLRSLEHAELAGARGDALLPLFVSLYQTYKDMGAYNEALYYYDKEYELIKDVPREAYTTLFNIAETLFLAKKPYDQVEKACLDARKAAIELNKRKYEIRILRSLLKYQEEFGETDKMEDTKSELLSLGGSGAGAEPSEDELSSAGGEEDAARLGDDIRLDELTDLSDTSEEDAAETRREARRRGKGFAVKRNMKGETQLHVACISGNKPLAERLLAQGHPVNVRDHAGWLPLHEACLHGHAALAGLLADHGARLDDRGGANCDGITPLYDAASNGHLEVVRLLLDRGALPSLRTDFGESPLQALRTWRAAAVLGAREEALYNHVCNTILGCGDKGDSSTSRTPERAVDVMSPGASNMSSAGRRVDSPATRRNVIREHSDDDDDDDDDVTKNVKQQLAFPSDSSDSSVDETTNGSVNARDASVDQYRSAISALRNRGAPEPEPEPEPEPRTPRPALLRPDEVGDDWLDDDLGTNRNHKRKPTDPLAAALAKRPAYEAIQLNTNRTEPLAERNAMQPTTCRAGHVVAVSDDSSDSGRYQRNENVRPKASPTGATGTSVRASPHAGDSRARMRRRCRRQASLLAAGFRRRVGGARSGGSGSDSDSAARQPDNSRTGHSSADNVGGSLARKRSADKFVAAAPGLARPQLLPPAAVKVRVEDKVLLVSLKLDSIDMLTIGWLVEEVASRYCKLTGVRPVFSLMTSDGAILCEDDPLGLVLTSPELKTCITDWKASPAEERYLECCEALGLAPCEEVRRAVAHSVATRRLALRGALGAARARPLLRALAQQRHLTAVLLPGARLGDAGLARLAAALSALPHLAHLDLGDNGATSAGTRALLRPFEAARPACPALAALYLASNPISDEGFRHVARLSRRVTLKSLKLNDCGMTRGAAVEPRELNFADMESLDISDNEVGMAMVGCLMSALSPDAIVDLEMDNVGAGGAVVGALAGFLDSARDLKLRKLALSNCNLVDGQFMRIYRSLGRAEHLQSVSLRDNQLTFIALKKLLQRQPPVARLHLQGCRDIFKYSPDSDFPVWLPAVRFGRCLPEIRVTPRAGCLAERDSLTLFSKTWLNCFGGRGVIEHGEGGLITFTAR